MSFEEDVRAGRISRDGWPDTAWFVRDGKIEKVTGWLKIQTLLREDDSYPTQMHGTREAAEEFVQMTYHPLEHAFGQYKAGKISLQDFQQTVGAGVAQERIERG